MFLVNSDNNSSLSHDDITFPYTNGKVGVMGELGIMEYPVMLNTPPRTKTAANQRSTEPALTYSYHPWNCTVNRLKARIVVSSGAQNNYAFFDSRK